MGDIKSYKTIWYYFAEGDSLQLAVGTDHKSQAVIFLKGVILILNWNKILLSVFPQNPNAEVSFKKKLFKEKGMQ